MKLAIFSGTGDGRLLCERLAARGVAADICVATAYGQRAMPALPGIRVHAGRLDREEMAAFLSAYDTVVDATHPYAAEATENIRAASRALGLSYYRLLRPGGGIPAGAVFVPSAQAAADYLGTVSGRALLTTGSRELEAFTSVADFADRLYPRVLPDADALEKCLRLGFLSKNLICMQGPFSREMNMALLRQTGAAYLVTKDSGVLGGFQEKISAAEELGVAVLVIGRPAEGEKGHTLRELEDILAGTPSECEAFGRFPLFIKLVGEPCVIIGGGAVACRRAETLLSFGGVVTVIAPEVAALPPGVLYISRAYRPGDCQNAALAVAATDDPQVNRAVAAECKAASVPVSVASDGAAGTVFFPAICKYGKLTAGLVSDGTDHHLTARAAEEIRRVLEECQK